MPIKYYAIELATVFKRIFLFATISTKHIIVYTLHKDIWELLLNDTYFIKDSPLNSIITLMRYLCNSRWTTLGDELDILKWQNDFPWKRVFAALNFKSLKMITFALTKAITKKSEKNEKSYVAVLNPTTVPHLRIFILNSLYNLFWIWIHFGAQCSFHVVICLLYHHFGICCLWK